MAALGGQARFFAAADRTHRSIANARPGGYPWWQTFLFEKGAQGMPFPLHYGRIIAEDSANYKMRMYQFWEKIFLLPRLF